MKYFKKITFITLTLLFIFSLSACGIESEKREMGGPIQMAEGDWDSSRVHNQIAKFIIEEGFDTEVVITTASTPATVTSLISGAFDVMLELWQGNIVSYDSDIDNGYYVEISTNFIDPGQGLWIPAYLQEEYPGLVTIQDLVDYKHLFEHPEAEAGKSLIHGGPRGWAATNFFITKFNNAEHYPELVEHFDFLPVGSTATLNSTLQTAYNNQEPWVGYHWAPTWPHAVFDLVRLEDELEYNPDLAEEYAVGDLPAGAVTVVVTAGFDEEYPEIFAMLSQYQTSEDITSEALNYLQINDNADARDAAIWFLIEYQELWTTWVDEDVATKVLDALKALE